MYIFLSILHILKHTAPWEDVVFLKAVAVTLVGVPAEGV